MHPTPHNWREARRLQAWHLKQQGWSQRQMAEALVVSEGAVRQGMARARNAGPEALRRRPPPGSPVAAVARATGPLAQVVASRAYRLHVI
jgi:transposase